VVFFAIAISSIFSFSKPNLGQKEIMKSQLILLSNKSVIIHTDPEFFFCILTLKNFNDMLLTNQIFVFFISDLPGLKQCSVSGSGVSN
jgi:hypothetical protein